jgi:uncharacterized protein
MNQLTKNRAILYHLYPGLLITAAFIILAPVVMRQGYPPQFALLVSIPIVVIPVFILHLVKSKREERTSTIYQLNGFTNKLPIGKLILYSLGLVFLAFLIWGITQPLSVFITKYLLFWLPDWYTIQDFNGYAQDKIRITLIANLALNGVLAPVAEEFYFRGYLLPRMENWGKSAFFINALLFSLYHFWQPYIYITLLLALLPMTYVVWKTKDLRVGMLTHSLMNIIGALLTFAMLNKA